MRIARAIVVGPIIVGLEVVSPIHLVMKRKKAARRIVVVRSHVVMEQVLTPVPGCPKELVRWPKLVDVHGREVEEAEASAGGHGIVLLIMKIAAMMLPVAAGIKKCIYFLPRYIILKKTLFLLLTLPIIK